MAANTCAQPPELYQGDGSTTKFDFPFPYIADEDIAVWVWDQSTKEYIRCTEVANEAACTGSPYEYYFKSATPVELYFCVAPPAPPEERPDDFSNVIIGRITNICSMSAYFYPGSPIRAEDLNNNFTQLLLAIQEVPQTVLRLIAEATISVDQIEPLIKAEDMQVPTVWDDTSLPTSGASKRYFENLISDVTPDPRFRYENGKLWFQEYTTNLDKKFQQLSIHDNGEWKTITSGQIVPNPFTPENIIYVDNQGSDDNPGRRPDEAYRTIKRAVAEANTRIPGTVSTVQSAIYDNVGGFVNITTTGAHNLIGGITVQVTPMLWDCTEGTNEAFPESTKNFRVSSVVGANEFRIYVGPNQYEHTYVSGGTITPADARLGDAYTILCAPGVYAEKFPITIEAKNLAIIGSSLRNTYVHPDITGESPLPIKHESGIDIYPTEVETMFEMDSGSYLTGFTFAGMKSAGARGAGGIDPDPTYGLPQRQGWVASHRVGSFITKSPYIQNCTHFSDIQTDNANFDRNNLAGEGGDTTSGPAGGGILVDGERVDPSSPLRSFVVDAFTQISLGGPGVLATNNGYAQLVSFFGTFCFYHAKSLNGGQLNLSNCTTDFGEYGLIADGRSASPIFSGRLQGDSEKGQVFLIVDSFTKGTLWEPPRTTTPLDHMVAEIDGVLYPLLGSNQIANGDSEIIIFSPKTDDFSGPGDKRTRVAAATYDNTTGIVNFTTVEEHDLISGSTVFIEPMVWSCTDPDGTDTFPKPPGGEVSTEFKILAVTGSKTFRIDTTDDTGYFSPKAHTYVSGGWVTPGVVSAGAFDNGGLKEDVIDGTTVKFYLQSYISTGGHTFEFTGSGTDYRAHPDFGGVGKTENQAIEIGGLGPNGSRLRYLNGGRVWLSSTDENGNFRVGETFNVNQKTGEIYILPEAVKENFILRQDLDLQGYKIIQNPTTNLPIQLQPSGDEDIILGTNVYESDGVTRENPAAIREPILERGLDDNRKWNVVSQRDLGYDADEIPVSCLLGQLAFTDTAPAVSSTKSAPLSNELKFEVSGNSLIIKYQPSDGGAVKTTTLTLS